MRTGARSPKLRASGDGRAVIEHTTFSTQPSPQPSFALHPFAGGGRLHTWHLDSSFWLKQLRRWRFPTFRDQKSKAYLSPFGPS